MKHGRKGVRQKKIGKEGMSLTSLGLKRISIAYSKLLDQTKKAVEMPEISDEEWEWMKCRPVKYRAIRRKNASHQDKTSR